MGNLALLLPKLSINDNEVERVELTKFLRVLLNEHWFKSIGSLSRAKQPFSGVQPEIIQGREGFVELGHFNKRSSKTSEKKGQGKSLEFFLLDALKTTF